eukprot:NODE_3387_length_674_cov_233.963200_g2413_i0.p1 GENE.NODE_3387_length_674_cov_233.963200_g2413_i0~~NODE_3387_length_674_cov_233.963200_g2413_i0.p1  ORF type:complete len:131 (-),score=14.81 NODE_3387_length_674_cov_233.963200_g2413_i0:180-572(-)
MVTETCLFQNQKWVVLVGLYSTALLPGTAFLNSFSKVYPCRYCGEHMADCIEEAPPRLESREALSVWVCELHNKVNDVLDKPIMDCNVEKLLQRWTPPSNPSASGAVDLDCLNRFCPEERRSHRSSTLSR